MKKYVIIVAGGSGSRMGSDTPKQFLLLQNLPILFHTITAFSSFPEELDIIVVLPAAQIDFFNELKEKYKFTTDITLVEGGTSRYHSVSNGLAVIQEKNALVAVHDGVRPFIKHSIIKESFDKAFAEGNAIASVSLKDSIRRKKGDTTESVDRSDYFLVQTPQTFLLERIQQGYGKEDGSGFTDDASVAESLGEVIHLISGDYKNIKITTPEDLIIAESIAKQWTY